METYNDQLFPPAFLVNYTKEPAGRQRVLTYSLFRFLSCVAEEQPDLAQFLADQVSCPSAEDSFEILEDYLKEDWTVATGNYHFEVPEDSYLMLGDNRNDSWDARYWTNPYVREDKILGKAAVIYWPVHDIGKLE